MAVQVRLISAGVRELLNDAGVRADLTRRMGRVLSAAKEGAAVESGAHRDSMRLEQGTTDRAVVRVVADTDHSLLVEARTGNMARALDSAGGA